MQKIKTLCHIGSEQTFFGNLNQTLNCMQLNALYNKEHKSATKESRLFDYCYQYFRLNNDIYIC